MSSGADRALGPGRHGGEREQGGGEGRRDAGVESRGSKGGGWWLACRAGRTGPWAPGVMAERGEAPGGARAQCRSLAARLVSLPPHLPTPCPRPPAPRGRPDQGLGRARGRRGRRGAWGRGGPTVSNRYKSIEFRIDSNGFKSFETVSNRLKRFQTDCNRLNPFQTVSNRLKRFQTVSNGLKQMVSNSSKPTIHGA